MSWIQGRIMFLRIRKSIHCGALTVTGNGRKRGRETEFRDFEAENARFQTIPKLSEITVDEMNYWLSRFALEVRKRDGTNYRHEVLYSLFCGLNREIKEKHPALSLFHSTELKPF